MPHGKQHAGSVRRLNQVFVTTLASEWVVQCQLPVALDTPDNPGGSAPEPDLAVAVGPNSRYCDHHPGPKEIRLVVEVADSTLGYDRSVKGRLYARAGIGIYWIVNLNDRQLEVYTRPNSLAERYRSRSVLAEKDQITLRWAKLAPVTFTVRDFLS